MSEQEVYDAPINLVWDNQPPADVPAKVIEDIRSGLASLAVPADLIIHVVDLCDDMKGPTVLVYGREGSDAFHCAYQATTEWVSLDDASNQAPQASPSQGDSKDG
jgi:hypothetical protein